MTKPTAEEIMAVAVVTARESCLLSRSELGRALEQAGTPRSAAWRFDTLGRVRPDELTAIVAVLTKRREDLTRMAADAQSAITALSKLNPTLVTEPDEPEPPTESKPTKRSATKAPAKKAPAKRAPRSSEAAVAE